MRRTIVPAVALLLALAPAARAQAGDADGVAVGVHLLGGTTPYPGLYGGMSQAIIGPSLSVDLPIGDSHHWTCSPSVGYGRGHWVQTVSGSISDFEDYNVEVWEGAVDFLHHPGTRGLSWGPGVFMNQAHFTHKLPGSSVRSQPYDTFGLELRAGAALPLGGPVELTGDACARLGWSHYELTVGTVTSELSNYTFSQAVRLGARVRL